MTSSPDEQQRIEALDPSQSFIVEAPAGSGKTELLIQRFLKLLTRVERPEQIIAITFTRKAAAEMRQRVMSTLRAAGSDDPSVPEYRKISLELAADVLRHSELHEWSLLHQPRRLRIMTIDSLNAALARQMPILSNGTISLSVADDTNRLYALAAKYTTESLGDAGPVGQGLRRLLAATDNSLLKLETLLAGSLAQRDRWLRAFANPTEQSLAKRVASNLEKLTAERLAAVRCLVGSDDEARLFDLLRQAGLRSEDSSALSDWRTATALLLTTTGGWRKRFTRREGFPADNKPLRATLNFVLEVLGSKNNLREALMALGAIPDASSTLAQPEQLEALEVVLPRLLAELKILFEQSGSVDHTEVALAAAQALGAVDQPSELLLALDRRIEHILVDEFQDTSHLQWRLLERLTDGWQAGDDRTLFLVGDPMQSIYRFRDADVGLFLKARHQGLGAVDLKSIALSENHRSAREIVDWVNASFAGIFPAGDAIQAGMPRFRSATSMRPPDRNAEVALHVLADYGYHAEIARVIAVVEQELTQNPTQSIGILVRSRAHLAGMRGALTAAGLAAHTIEIDSVSDTQLGQDLIGFTSALVHHGDRLGWFGLLRSPWCGLDWSDLLALGRVASERTIWESIQDIECRAQLSAEGAARAHWLADRLQQGYALRPTRTFGRWVRDCWLLIDGPAALASESGLDQAERYFVELESLANNGDIDDPAMIRSHFAAPVAGNDSPTQSGIEIMTMHRAKGLEFDTVILPGLGRVTRGNQSNLLLLQEFNTSDREGLSLLAAATDSQDPLVTYLNTVERERDSAERARLLYVASTRAKQRLHLIGSVDRTNHAPKTGSLLATLWPGLAATPPIEIPPTDGAAPGTDFVAVPLRCLTFDGALPALPAGEVTPATLSGPRPDFEWVRPASVQTGTLIHRELQRWANQAARTGEAARPDIDRERYRRELALLGVDDEDLSSGAKRVADALEKVWGDDVGRWILQPWPEAWSELRLTVRENNRLNHVQLDRSFVDAEGRRWIIDFKSGQHLGSNVDQFLDSEVDRYRPQLERYAQAVAAFDNRPIRVGLYFPLMTALRDWEPTQLNRAGR